MSIHILKPKIAQFVFWKFICLTTFSECTQSIKFYREVQSSLSIKFVQKSLGKREYWPWTAFGQVHQHCWKYAATQGFLFSLITASVSKLEFSIFSWCPFLACRSVLGKWDWGEKVADAFVGIIQFQHLTEQFLKLVAWNEIERLLSLEST